MQVSPKSQVEWGYNKDGSWVFVDKAILDAAGEGVEKMIGFEGKPDPATGFYCVRTLLENIPMHRIAAAELRSLSVRI
jgi:hypothetical protein